MKGMIIEPSPQIILGMQSGALQAILMLTVSDSGLLRNLGVFSIEWVFSTMPEVLKEVLYKGYYLLRTEAEGVGSRYRLSLTPILRD